MSTLKIGATHDDQYEYTYQTVGTDHEALSLVQGLLDMLADGWEIISTAGSWASVHYVLRRELTTKVKGEDLATVKVDETLANK